MATTRTPLMAAIFVVIAGAVAVGGSLEAGTSPPKLGPDHRVQPLTPPSDADPLDIAAGYLADHSAELGLSAADLATLELEQRYHSETLGTNLFYQQRINGVPVFNAITSVHVLDSGAILTVNNTAVSDIAGKLSATEPSLSAADAFVAALQHLGRDPGIPTPVRSGDFPQLDSARQGVAFTGAGVTQRPVPVQLIYVERPDGQVRLAWEVYAMTSGSEVWYLHVDAVDGSVLEKHNLVYTLDQYRVYPYSSESPISTESPVDLGHDLVEEPGDTEASPNGWVDGTTTTGNNVEAVEDRDDNNSGGFQPTAVGAPGSLVFDFAHDDLENPCEQPTATSNVASNPENLEPCDPFDPVDHNSNLEASIVNLFYWNNMMHDVMFHYGFTEGAGNFQQTNFTAEGTFRDFDAVFAQAQDGSGTNNANFFTPPDDGVTPILLPPAMQMYEWSPPAVVTVNLPSDFDDFDDGDNILAAATASFGAKLKDLSEAERTGDVELGDDGSTGDGTGSVNDGCEPLVGFTPGNIALLYRGSCEFGVKMLNAEDAGAKAVVLGNSAGQEVGVPMGPGEVGDQVTIPSVMIGHTNANRLRDAAAAGLTNVTLQILPVPNRDSDLDAGVIAHEYGHGISNRLVGGPTSIACLINGVDPVTLDSIGEQMGEGWSDFYALIMTGQLSDTANTPRGVGPYVTFQDENGPGIRRFPYTRDMAVNPFTYGDVPDQTAPHGVGSVWATMVWDMHWNLVDDHGFEPDLFNHASHAGNVRTLHYINDGLVVTACRPSFVDGRDAILVAEAADGDTEDECAIWGAFARRGLGVAALNPTGGEDHRTVIEDFTVPPQCASAGNQAPTAADDAYSTSEDTPLDVAAPGVLGNDSDPDGDPMTASLLSGPANAESFTLNADGSFSYDPAPGFLGMDSFTYVAQDAETSSDEATATIEVTCAEFVTVSNKTIDDVDSDLACDTLTAAPNVEVVAPDGDYHMRAGRKIILGDGFRVESGAKLLATIDSSLLLVP